MKQGYGPSRRRWSWEDKQAAVELSFTPNCTVAAVAACCGVIPAQIYAWRREVRDRTEADLSREEIAFLPAVLEPPTSPEYPRLVLTIELRSSPKAPSEASDGAKIASMIALLETMR